MREGVAGNGRSFQRGSVRFVLCSSEQLEEGGCVCVTGTDVKHSGKGGGRVCSVVSGRHRWNNLPGWCIRQTGERWTQWTVMLMCGDEGASMGGGRQRDF